MAKICEDPYILRALRIIMDILRLLSFALPAILVIISTVDIGKTVINADRDALLQKFGLAAKRIILAVLIFSVPTFVNTFVSLLEDGSANIMHRYNTCFDNIENIEYYEKLDEKRKEEEKNKLKELREAYSSKLKENTKASLEEEREARKKRVFSNPQVQAGPLTPSTTIPSDIINANSKTKLNYLFPNGTPTTPLGMQLYLTNAEVPMTKKDGTKFNGKLLVHKALVKDIQDVFQIAQNGGFKIYQAGAYSFRSMNNGGSGRLSHHSYGVAIDINVDENYSHRGGKVYAGKFWDPSRSEYSIPKDGILVQAFKAKGWKWGGDWSGNYQDYMHFSFTGN